MNDFLTLNSFQIRYAKAQIFFTVYDRFCKAPYKKKQRNFSDHIRE